MSNIVISTLAYALKETMSALENNLERMREVERSLVKMRAERDRHTLEEAELRNALHQHGVTPEFALSELDKSFLKGKG